MLAPGSVSWDDVRWARCGMLLEVTTVWGLATSSARAVPLVWGGGPDPAGVASYHSSVQHLRGDPVLACELIRFATAYPGRRGDLGSIAYELWPVVRDPQPGAVWRPREDLDDWHHEHEVELSIESIREGWQARGDYDVEEAERFFQELRQYARGTRSRAGTAGDSNHLGYRRR